MPRIRFSIVAFLTDPVRRAIPKGEHLANRPDTSDYLLAGADSMRSLFGSLHPRLGSGFSGLGFAAVYLAGNDSFYEFRNMILILHVEIHVMGRTRSR